MESTCCRTKVEEWEIDPLEQPLAGNKPTAPTTTSNNAPLASSRTSRRLQIRRTGNKTSAPSQDWEEVHVRVWDQKKAEWVEGRSWVSSFNGGKFVSQQYYAGDS